MMLRDAVESDIKDIVSVHQRAFDGFFLTKLGPLFLTELYRSFGFRQGGVLRVLCNEEGHIVGFAAGALEPASFFHDLKKERALAFLWRASPGLLRNPVLVVKKLWYAAFYKGEEPTKLVGAALLSSIAVSPDMMGKSLGKKLLLDYEDVARDRGVSALFLTTDKNGNDDVVSFYLNTGYSIESRFVQADGREMLRFIKILGEKNE